MYRYGFFVTGLYGSPIEDSFLTGCIRRLLETYPETADQFSVPEDIEGIFFSMFYEHEEVFAPDLLAACTNRYIDTVLVYDSMLCNIYIHKGLGDAQMVFDDHIDRIKTVYEGAFENPFEWVDMIDKRTSMEDAPCAN